MPRLQESSGTFAGVTAPLMRGLRTARDQRMDLQEAQLRSGRLRAGGDHVAHSQRAGGAQRFPRRHGEELHRLREGSSRQGELRVAGLRTASHLTAELFMALTKTSLVHVPYKGTSPALNDLVAGHVDSSFIVLSSALELARAGKLRILAVATDKRIGALPELPTLVARGYPE